MYNHHDVSSFHHMCPHILLYVCAPCVFPHTSTKILRCRIRQTQECVSYTKVLRAQILLVLKYYDAGSDRRRSGGGWRRRGCQVYSPTLLYMCPRTTILLPTQGHPGILYYAAMYAPRYTILYCYVCRGCQVY